MFCQEKEIKRRQQAQLQLQTEVNADFEKLMCKMKKRLNLSARYVKQDDAHTSEIIKELRFVLFVEQKKTNTYSRYKAVKAKLFSFFNGKPNPKITCTADTNRSNFITSNFAMSPRISKGGEVGQSVCELCGLQYANEEN